MNNFLKLVWNEQIKLYSKKSAWIMIAFIAMAALVGGLVNTFMDTDILKTEYGENWKEELQTENVKLTAEMEQDEFASFSNPMIIEKNNYHLENNIKPKPYDAWEYVLENAMISSLLSLFTIIVAAGIIANEFQWGTIKLLLIRPISRTKILLAKYVSVLVFAATLLVSLLIFSWVIGALFFGVNGLSPNIVISTADGFAESNVIKEILVSYGFKMVTLVMMATFAFMISTIFRSSSMAIGLAIFLMMAGSTMMSFVSRYEWSKYILFANTNLMQYFNGAQPLVEGMTLTFSIIVLGVYFVVFHAAAWIAFTKRDVAGH
ncbi:ABC transporter permease [Planococcus shenhongbingii]|uniref:ABC transporter permease n=1 Tax=Planococcus shenhongbingii TaxID=3058398 RepID=A0ABT8N8M0_9BACL|nr:MULTISPECIES: ABC transporter permease [unclassified Planococcus (in: firmicutes)]MDN7244243.1 ABC transporter permease [Planococcus sp. N017]WKA57415.1 ABC transporter permease [Planococcus sp. N016]